MESKLCTMCHVVKILEDFPKEKRAKGGRRNQCKECRYKYLSTIFPTEKRREYQREYRKTETGKEAHKKGLKKWTKGPKGKAWRKREDVKEYFREKVRKYEKRNPDKVAARRAVKKAMENGTIQRAKLKACFHCGLQASDWHHHKGYAKEFQLDVIALCKSCHIKEHQTKKPPM